MKKIDKDTVIQPNAIARSVYNCTPLERKLIFYACKCRSKDKKQLTTSFKISDFQTALHINYDKNTGGKFKIDLRNAVERLSKQHNTIFLCSETNVFYSAVWFQSIYYNSDTDSIELQFSETIGYLIYGLRKNFELLSLETIGGLKSFYSIRFYELAISYRGFQGTGGNSLDKWYFEITIDDIRCLFQLSDTYKIHEIVRRIITPALTELNKQLSDFVITFETLHPYGKKRLVSGYRFNCQLKGLLAIAVTGKIPPLEQLDPAERENEQKISKMTTAFFNDYVSYCGKYPKQEIELMPFYNRRILEIMEKDGFNFE